MPPDEPPDHLSIRWYLLPKQEWYAKYIGLRNLVLQKIFYTKRVIAIVARVAVHTTTCRVAGTNRFDVVLQMKKHDRLKWGARILWHHPSKAALLVYIQYSFKPMPAKHVRSHSHTMFDSSNTLCPKNSRNSRHSGPPVSGEPYWLPRPYTGTTARQNWRTTRANIRLIALKQIREINGICDYWPSRNTLCVFSTKRVDPASGTGTKQSWEVRNNPRSPKLRRMPSKS